MNKGLFLFGLIIFLRDLNWFIYITIFVITAATVFFYFGTTIIPCFIPFCPYETPLSSLKLWGYCYQLPLATGQYVYGMFSGDHSTADFTNHKSPCEQQELMTSTSTSPDEVTGHALSWIMIHAQDSDTRGMAIRAISGLNSEETLRQLVAESPGIFPQVIQGFTSCVDVDVRAQEEDGRNQAPLLLDAVLLHVQALIILVNLVVHKRGTDRTVLDSEYLATWGVDDETVDAVERKLNT